MSDEKLSLLDTHIWVWLVLDDSRLDKALAVHAQRECRAGHARLSAISIWEVAMLESKGRLKLGAECGLWVRESLLKSGVGLVPLTPEIAVDSTRLTGEFHGDPSDRIIVATARRLGATLLTADAGILRYAKQGHVRVMAV